LKLHHQPFEHPINLHPPPAGFNFAWNVNAMASRKKTPVKKPSKKTKEDPFEIAETRKRLKHQQQALKKIIKSFGNNKTQKED
jgi:hypothetical protein